MAHTNLLHLDSLRELLAERQVGNGNVLKGNVELGRPFNQRLSDALRDKLSLRNQLTGIKLGLCSGVEKSGEQRKSHHGVDHANHKPDEMPQNRRTPQHAQCS